MVAAESFLIIEFDGDVVRTLPLVSGVIKIGRGPDNDLSLQHRGVSRNHLELTISAGSVIATDLGSGNGTFIDGVRLLPHQPTQMEPGRELRVGPFVLAIRRSPADLPGFISPAPPAIDGAAEDVDSYWDNPPPSPPPVERRPKLDVPAPTSPVSQYLNYLPATFADSNFLGRYLLIFESIWEPLEQRQDHMDMYVSPSTCPATFVPWLASWFGLNVAPHWPESRGRDLVARGVDLYRWRGTAYGLKQIIEMWTGITPEIDVHIDSPFVFRVRMALPSGSDVDRLLVEDLVREHKPAHAGYVLEFTSAGASSG